MNKKATLSMLLATKIEKGLCDMVLDDNVWSRSLTMSEIINDLMALTNIARKHEIMITEEHDEMLKMIIDYTEES